MKGYRDTKPMKREGHHFDAGGFTGSAGMQAVKSHMRKTPGEPVKPDFKRRAMLPGGLATGGVARATSTEAAVSGGAYAKGGKARKRGAVPKHAAPAGVGAPLVTVNTDPAGADPQVGAQAPAIPLKSGGKAKRGGLTAEANLSRGKSDAAKLDRAAASQPHTFKRGGVPAYSKKPALGSR